MGTTNDSPGLRFRLILGESIAIGPDKADLLAAIAASGSISAAGRSMGMSYKKAWYLVDTMNRCFREPLVLASKGGSGRGGAQLTSTGVRVLALYRAIEARAAASAKAELDEFASFVRENLPVD